MNVGRGNQWEIYAKWKRICKFRISMLIFFFVFRKKKCHVRSQSFPHNQSTHTFSHSISNSIDEKSSLVEAISNCSRIIFWKSENLELDFFVQCPLHIQMGMNVLKARSLAHIHQGVLDMDKLFSLLLCEFKIQTWTTLFVMQASSRMTTLKFLNYRQLKIHDKKYQFAPAVLYVCDRESSRWYILDPTQKFHLLVSHSFLWFG